MTIEVKDNNQEVWTFDCEYASQDPDLKTLPGGSYINKHEAGCGLTTVVLENEQNVVIATCNVPLITNKVAQYVNTQFEDNPLVDYPCRERFAGEVLGVWEGVTTEDVNAYYKRVRESGTPVKIIVCIDSLMKTEEVIPLVDLFCIDEADTLLEYSPLKAKSKKKDDNTDVITRVYELAHQHMEKVCFFTATPVEHSFLPEWVTSLRQITMQWTKAVKQIPILMDRKKPFVSLREEVLKPLLADGSVSIGGRSFSKVIIALNSVQQSQKIIRELEIPKDMVMILCGKSPRNAKSLGKRYGEEFSPYMLPKILFLTSAHWRGLDLYDREAMTIIVSSTSQPWHMVDLSTQLRQACRRQRDKQNPNYDAFVFIYNRDIFKKTEEELLKEWNDQHKTFERNCTVLNTLYEAGKVEEAQSLVTTLQGNRFFARYVNFISGTGFCVNENHFQAELRKIIVTRRTYDLTSKVDELMPVQPIIIPDPDAEDETSYEHLLTMFRKVKKGEQVEFTDQQVASDNYRLLQTCLQVFDKLPARRETAEKKCSHIGNDDAQYEIDLLAPFQEGSRYQSSFIEKHMKSTYKKYGVAQDIDMQTNIRVLEYYGVKLKKVKASTIRYDILEMPDQKF